MKRPSLDEIFAAPSMPLSGGMAARPSLDAIFSEPVNASLPQEKGNFWEGYGNAFAKLGVGAKQRVLEIAQTMGSDAAVEELNKINDLAKKLDMQGEGKGFGYKAGEFAGNVVPGLAFPAARTMAGAIGVAGATGAGQEFLQSNDPDGRTAGENLTKKALDAGISGAFSAATVPAVNLLAQGGRTVLKKFLPDSFTQSATGNIEEITRKAAQESPELAEKISQESPDVVQAFAKNMDSGLTPQQALLKAKADEYGVRTSRGDITADLTQQSREEAALKGMMGQDTQMIAQSFREGQANDLRTMATNVGKRVGGGQELPGDMQDVADRITSSVTKKAKAEMATAREAYDNAGLNKARANIEDVYNYRHSLRSELSKEGFDKDLTPSAYNVYSKLDKYLQDSRKKGLKTINLQHVEGFRKLMNKVGKTAPPADARMLGIMKNTLDTTLDDALEKGLIQGNTESIANIKNARGLWHSYKQRYYGKDGKAFIGKIIDNDYTPEKTMQLLIGTGKAGGKAEAATAIKQLRGVLGENSEEFNALRGEVFKRLVGQDLALIAPGDIPQGFNGVKFRNNVKELAKTNKSLVQELYGNDTWKAIEDAAEFAGRITHRKDGVVNYSNTTPTLVRFLNSTAAKFGPIGRYIAAPVAGTVEKVTRQAEKASAQQAFSEPVQQQKNFSQALAQRIGIATGGGVSQARQALEKSSREDEKNLQDSLKGIKIINPYE